jgi:hypothetical protein
LADINNGTAGVSGMYKGEIIISFLKDHSVKNDWVNANPVFAGLITSRHFDTVHLESLFESCRINSEFTTKLEEFIRKNIS